MLTEFEGKVVRSLETIAGCLEKQVQTAEEAMKKTQELYVANMAMIKESQIELQTPDSNTPISEDEDDMEDDMPF